MKKPLGYYTYNLDSLKKETLRELKHVLSKVYQYQLSKHSQKRLTKFHPWILNGTEIVSHIALVEDLDAFKDKASNLKEYYCKLDNNRYYNLKNMFIEDLIILLKLMSAYEVEMEKANKRKNK